MANQIFTLYNPRANPPDSDFPTGSIKDQSTPTSNDGTPLTAAWGNDYVGYTAALLGAVGINHNGTPDTANASQRLEALLTLIGYQPLSGGGTLSVNRNYLLSDNGTYTLPDTTGLTDGDYVALIRLGGTLSPTINVDGTNSEEIEYYNFATTELDQTDTSVLYSILSPIRFVLKNGNWQL